MSAPRLQMAGLLPRRGGVAADLRQRRFVVAAGKGCIHRLGEVGACDGVSGLGIEDGRGARAKQRVASQRAQAGQERLTGRVVGPEVAKRSEQERVRPQQVELLEVAKRPPPRLHRGLAENVVVNYCAFVAPRVCLESPPTRAAATRRASRIVWLEFAPPARELGAISSWSGGSSVDFTARRVMNLDSGVSGRGRQHGVRRCFSRESTSRTRPWGSGAGAGREVSTSRSCARIDFRRLSDPAAPY